LKVKGFFPQFDFPDRPLEKVAMDLSKELIDSSCDTWDGITIRRPDLHAAGIELGMLGMERMMKTKNWAPTSGPPIWWILCFGDEKASEVAGRKEKGAEERASPERPIEK
jgi:hypothetical protein